MGVGVWVTLVIVFTNAFAESKCRRPLNLLCAIATGQIRAKTNAVRILTSVFMI